MHLQQQLQQKINNKTKPHGALGQLETMALQVGLIQQTLTPQIKKPTIVVFAADHGIAADGKVNPYPQAVTAQMVLNFVQGGAAINVFCKQNNIELVVADAGVNVVFDNNTPITHAKVAMGTADYSKQPAMTLAQTAQAIEKGAAIVEAIFNSGCNCIGFGEMGIGNTSSAALIMHYYTQLPLAQCVGRGTGANDVQLANKLHVLEQAVTLHQLINNSYSAETVLSKIGGFEIAMMAGAFVKAWQLNMIIVVDGFITTAALLNAKQLLQQQQADANILTHCIFAHCSGEQGHEKMLQHLQATPLLKLGLRLGEGTGAALAMPLLQAATAFLNEMASFESAGVSNKE
ncbi:MAG: nicotinate-nucleotide--dimethylbenzimidazole phosphoribosyltransferase [Bacteroidota bacterium]|jgi:nicotinate-nucleotide--dimethylbenzimidazole phosphoribosyltransferase